MEDGGEHVPTASGEIGSGMQHEGRKNDAVSASAMSAAATCSCVTAAGVGDGGGVEVEDQPEASAAQLDAAASSTGDCEEEAWARSGVRCGWQRERG